MMDYKGAVIVVGDNVNTDYIISSRRKRDTVDPQKLKEYFMEDLDQTIRPRVHDGDILVAGENFGCGSAMEVAVTVIQALGIKAVIARSFARSFFRNAINNGLPVVETDTSCAVNGDVIQVCLYPNRTTVHIENKDITMTAAPFSSLVLAILREGGIVPYLLKNARF